MEFAGSPVPDGLTPDQLVAFLDTVSSYFLTDCDVIEQGQAYDDGYYVGYQSALRELRRDSHPTGFAIVAVDNASTHVVFLRAQVAEADDPEAIYDAAREYVPGLDQPGRSVTTSCDEGRPAGRAPFVVSRWRHSTARASTGDTRTAARAGAHDATAVSTAPATTTNPMTSHGIPGTTIPPDAAPSSDWAPAQP